METVLQIRDAEKSYAGKKALDKLSLDIREGEALAVVGPNGAGKSTLIDVMLGIKKLDGGTVVRSSSLAKAAIGVQFQTPTFFPGLHVLDNVKLFAALNGKAAAEQELMDLLIRCRLQDSAYSNAYRLSGGQQKRLAIAIALVHRPKLLVLDEPTAALDPGARSEIKEMLGELAASGISIVFTSHDMSEVKKLAHRVAFVVNGKVRLEGNVKHLLEANGTDDLDELYDMVVKKGGEQP